MPDSGKQSIKNIAQIIQNLELENPLTQKDLARLYTFLETEFDEKMENIESLILKEIENNSKFKNIQSLSERLQEINSIK